MARRVKRAAPKKKQKPELTDTQKKDAQLRARRNADKNARKRASEFAAKRIRGLQTWKVTEMGEGKIGIECPHANCRGKAVVNKKKWVLYDTDFRSRGCTYCYKIAWIPVETLPKGDDRRNVG